MALNLRQAVVGFLKDRAEQKFTVRQIAEWLLQIYKEPRRFAKQPKCRGLRVSSRERGRSGEWRGESGMWPGTATSADRRSPQALAGTRTSTRELARSGKKKPQPRTVGVWLFGGDGGS